MTLLVPAHLLHQVHLHGEQAYPEEGAGFLLGVDEGQQRRVSQVLTADNMREDDARRRRYLITPEAYLQAEITADRLGLSLIGVFHSHPDHPNRPSEFDREWAQPFFSYLITGVEAGRVVESRSWRLVEDRSRFEEESIQILEERG